jgi:hypothetical protein
MKAKLLALFLFAMLATRPSSATSGCLGAGVPPATEPPNAQANPTATFRVVLNGFKVKNESDDDIFEGDGRGDEIFITAHRWMINRDGSARPVPLDDPSSNPYQQTLPYLITKVMGDPINHPERVPAGTRGPGQRLDLDNGGLQTGDTYPTLTPWRRDREPLADRPPIILWQGNLTRGQNMVEIVPIIWEWDSPAYSASQRAILDGGLTTWFEEHRQKLADHIPASDINPRPASWRDSRSDLGTPLGYDEITLHDKAGTRPIGYGEFFGEQAFRPQSIVLTYDSALNAVNPRNQSERILEIEYKDSHDHGDYILYIQVEQVTSFRQTIQQRVRRP